MASIEEVWGSPFPKRQPLSNKSAIPEKRDAQKEGRVYNSPQERTQATVFKNRKTIDDLTRTLPIVSLDIHVEQLAPVLLVEFSSRNNQMLALMPR